MPLFTVSCPKICRKKHQIQSGENEENHLGRFLAIHDEEVKNNKGGVKKQFEKYLDSYIWLKGEPKFRFHVLNPPGGTVPEDISVSEMLVHPNLTVTVPFRM